MLDFAHAFRSSSMQSIGKKVSLVLFALIPLCSLGMTGPSDQFDFLYPGDDDVKAAELLSRTFTKTSLEWDIDYDQGDKNFILRTSEFIFVVHPVTFKEKYDFLQFTFVNAKKDGVSNSSKAYLSLVNDLNLTFRRAQFSIAEDGELFIQFYHQFRNRLTTDDIKELVEIFEGIITFVFTKRNEDLAEFIR